MYYSTAMKHTCVLVKRIINWMSALEYGCRLRPDFFLRTPRRRSQFSYSTEWLKGESLPSASGLLPISSVWAGSDVGWPIRVFVAVGVSGEESVNCGTVMTLWDKIWSDKRQKMQIHCFLEAYLIHKSLWKPVVRAHSIRNMQLVVITGNNRLQTWWLDNNNNLKKLTYH